MDSALFTTDVLPLRLKLRTPKNFGAHCKLSSLCSTDFWDQQKCGHEVLQILAHTDTFCLL